MTKQKIVDHLFRHQYGKMVAILTNYFGLAFLESIEDAVQDTFIKATLQWRTQLPENPEAWLMTVAKNRTIDLIRKLKKEKTGLELKELTIVSDHKKTDLFLEHEIEDSQLRMLFVACHPALAPEEQIAFALKTISGFSMKEIAAALLLKEETIKKRLVRVRKKIIDQQLNFEYPNPKKVNNRISGVLQVVYLIFNEGFHSTKTNQLISKDLCGEALRLCKLLLKKEGFRSGSLYALFALLCFHAARIESKITATNQIVDLEHQDRSKWYMPLIILGNDAFTKTEVYSDWSAYHYEAAIAKLHISALQYKNTDWKGILEVYKKLYKFQPSDATLLNMAIVYMKLKQMPAAKKKLDSISIHKLQQRSYLLYGCYAEYYQQTNNKKLALEAYNTAILQCPNSLEKKYIEDKRAKLLLA